MTSLLAAARAYVGTKARFSLVALIAALLAWAALPAQPAAASTGVGGQLYSTGGTVTVTYNGSSAGYTSDLYLYPLRHLHRNWPRNPGRHERHDWPLHCRR